MRRKSFLILGGVVFSLTFYFLIISAREMGYQTGLKQGYLDGQFSLLEKMTQELSMKKPEDASSDNYKQVYKIKTLTVFGYNKGGDDFIVVEDSMR